MIYGMDFTLRVCGDMVIENKTVHDNFKYGIDPHTGSHDMKIRNNDIHNSRIGLICSLECSNLIFEKNRIEGNKEVGLMFSKKTVNSTARLNNISLSNTGIAVSDSHSNSVYENAVSRSVDGLSVKNNSSDNMLFNNTISDPKDCGIIVALASAKQHNGIQLCTKLHREWNLLVKGCKSQYF